MSRVESFTRAGSILRHGYQDPARQASPSPELVEGPVPRCAADRDSARIQPNILKNPINVR